jgi:hypothetical protein
VAAVAGTVLAAAVPLSSAQRALSPCTGSMLAGSFKVVPGSAGAGNIVYRLKLSTTGGKSCFVTGIPGLTLLDKTGHTLPTNAKFAGKPGSLAAVMVPIGPGKSAALTARFSPDIPGPGEPAMGGSCEKPAYKLRVAPSGGGAAVVPISPPTPVCEHGGLQITVFTVS